MTPTSRDACRPASTPCNRHRHRAPHWRSGVAHIPHRHSADVPLFSFLFPLSPYLPSALSSNTLSILIIIITFLCFILNLLEHRTFLRTEEGSSSSFVPHYWLPAIQPRGAATTWRHNKTSPRILDHSIALGHGGLVTTPAPLEIHSRKSLIGLHAESRTYSSITLFVQRLDNYCTSSFRRRS